MRNLIIIMFGLFLGARLMAQGAGDCLNFDGSDDYISVPDHAVFDFSAFTLEAWINPGNLSSVHDIIGKGSGWTPSTYGFNLETTGTSLYGSVFNSSGTQFYKIAGTLTIDTWQHVAITWTSGGSLVLYINGVNVGSNPSTFSGTIANSAPLIIGTFSWTFQFYFNGSIDEIRIWNTARSQTQIRENMCQILTGSESGLVAYYKMTDGSGSTLTDNSSQSNSGTLQNMDNSDWITSGAALGDASTYDYDGGDGYSVNLASSYNDDVTATTTSGTIGGLQLYRVDEAPNVTTPPAGMDQLSQHHYFGVLAVGSSVIYTVTYNYDGHPGILDENNLKLAKRDDNADGSWADAGATLDTDANTLTKTGENGTEYILGSANGNALPVKLFTFTGYYKNRSVVLEWITASEINAIGFILHRRAQSEPAWQQIASYQTNSDLVCLNHQIGTADYSFIDNTIQPGETYTYRLSDVDVPGNVTVLKEIEVSTTAVAGQKNATLPEHTALHAAYPNPFNPATTIEYQLAEAALIELAVYNLKGEQIFILVNQQQVEGHYTTQWNGLDDSGRAVGSGVYFIRLCSGSFSAVVKVNLLR